MYNVKEENGIVVLETWNFEEVITDDTTVLVSFYAPWSGKWKQLSPAYIEAAAKLKAEGSEIRLAKVDGTSETKLMEKYKINDFPTFRLFKNGSLLEYNGNLEIDEVLHWLKKMTEPPAKELTTPEELNNFIAHHEAVLIGNFGNSESDVARAFIRAAGSMYDIEAGICTPEIAATANIPADSIVVLSKFREGIQVVENSWDANVIVAQARHLSLPWVREFTDETAPKIFGSAIKSHAMLFVSKSSNSYKGLYSDFEAVAKVYVGKLQFIIIDTDVESNDRILDFFSIKKEDTPVTRIINLVDEDMIKYRMEEAYSTDNFQNFVQSYIDGKLKPHLKSQEIPEKQEGPVLVLVGKNFKEFVYNSKKDIFVNFYASWSGQCRQLAPIWEELAHRYSDSEKVVIAQVDGTANEVEAVKVSSFPTLVYIKSNGEIIYYNGERTLDDFIQFVEADGVENPADGVENFL